MKQIKSLQDLDITKDFEGVKIRASNLLKKRKKMSNIIKEYQINKISQFFQTEISPLEFAVTGGKMERSRTEPSHKLPCMKTKVNNNSNQQEFLPLIKNTQSSLNKQLSTTLKRVLRYSRPCHHSIVSYYPAAPVPQGFHITSNFETRKQTQTQIRINKRRKQQKLNQLVQSSILTRDKSTTLQYQEIKRYYEQKYCKQK